MSSSTFESEITSGERYGFGANWLRFLELVDEDRVEEATHALRRALGVDSLVGKTFLDIGSGSGLSSLAALRLGARVTSFDYDTDSVRCTTKLRALFAPDSGDNWKVLQGSVLDQSFMNELEPADVVYSWGVLHHTGDMYGAIRNAAAKVRPGALLSIALYRRTILCEFWKIEKRLYSKSPEAVRRAAQAAWVAKTRLAFALKRRDFDEMVRTYGASGLGRAMDYYRDVDDWLGGYPYESITPAECRAFVGGLGFELKSEKAVTQGVHWALSSGCDEWLFRRTTG